MVNQAFLCRLYVALVLLAGGWSVASAEEPSALAVCAACHGTDGVGIDASYANLGGQHADYLVLQLKAFRSGDRSNPIMNPIAAQLSDQDITELALWFSLQPLVATANGNPALVEEGRNRAGYCHACHGMEGHPVATEWPILAGQSAPYIANQLMGFKRGARYHPLMINMVRDLDPSAMSALGAYYARVVRAN